jgi:hypothetical protein
MVKVTEHDVAAVVFDALMEFFDGKGQCNGFIAGTGIVLGAGLFFNESAGQDFDGLETLAFLQRAFTHHLVEEAKKESKEG